jgi:hypothetical protein
MVRAKTMAQKTFSLTEADYHAHVEAYDGICLECGEWSFGGVEPDAEGYKCSDCGAMAVMGAENAMIREVFDFEAGSFGVD